MLRTHLPGNPCPPLSSVSIEAYAALDENPEFLRAVFGIVAHKVVEPRDYSGLLRNLAAPPEALLGDAPLLPRQPFERCPSLVDERSREDLARVGLTVTIAQGAGHNVPAEAGPAFLAAPERLMAPLGPRN